MKGCFSRAYTTETVPEGHYELEQLVRSRDQRAYGDYSALDLKSEFEYGIRRQLPSGLLREHRMARRQRRADDNLTSLTVATHRKASREFVFFRSLAVEFIYRVSSPVSSPIGIAFITSRNLTSTTCTTA